MNEESKSTLWRVVGAVTALGAGAVGGLGARQFDEVQASADIAGLVATVRAQGEMGQERERRLVIVEAEVRALRAELLRPTPPLR